MSGEIGVARRDLVEEGWGKMHFVKRFAVSIGLLLALSISTGCSGKLSSDEREALHAYENFVATLHECNEAPDTCDKGKVWDGLDVETKQQFLYAYSSLVRIDRIIAMYFDPIEHKQMRERTGTDILQSQNITDFKGLFNYMFHPEAFNFDANVESGLEFVSSRVEDANHITIETHQKNQEFPMVREDDGVWRTKGLQHAVDRALDPIFKSEDAMKEYAQSYLVDEMARRARVREHFKKQQALMLQQH